MESTTLLLIAALLLGFLIFWRRDPEARRIRKMMDKIPGEPVYPILGTVLPCLFAKPEDYLNMAITMVTKYKPLLKVWFGPIPAVVITDPDYVKAVLNNTEMIEKAAFYKLFHPWLGFGLFTSTGQKWHSRRKIITPSFHFKILEQFIPIFAENSDILVNELRKEVGREVFDVNPYIFACSLDIICESAMGTSVNAQRFGSSDYIDAMHNMKEIFTERIAKPYLLADFIFNLTKWGKLQAESLKVIHGLTKKVIKERKEQRANESQKIITEDDMNYGRKRRLAFLDMLLEAAENGANLTDRDIKEEVDTFMFGGHDTVMATVSYCLFLLGLHPDIQDRVYQELRNIFQDSDRSPTPKDLQDMKYLQMVIKETLRFFQIAPVIARYVPQDFELGHHKIPAGVNVIIPIIMLHHDPDIFPNPKEFNPDNFLPENVVKRHPFVYIPFSAGPRSCIGQKFAMLEMKVMVSSVLRHYEIRSVDKVEDLVLLFEVILKPKNGFRISITPRKSNKVG
ncbi:cytochrome P450 4C1-like isoform X2 [Periplaneta americana]|uniref:cytochrome P450 4C1-like isoform X2 n=1 Tax=Periplaneta americana TaxID=6978 RepID=UPI0037E76B29